MLSIGAAQPRLRPRGPDRRRVQRGGRRAEDQPGRHPRIAIIEPYDGARRPCARYLEYFNFDVAEAAGVEDGLAILESTPPALILIEHADLAGVDRFLERVRTLGIPLVAMTSAFVDSEGGSIAPPAGVLLKPFTLGAMIDEIRRVLRAHDVARIA